MGGLVPELVLEVLALADVVEHTGEELEAAVGVAVHEELREDRDLGAVGAADPELAVPHPVLLEVAHDLASEHRHEVVGEGVGDVGAVEVAVDGEPEEPSGRPVEVQQPPDAVGDAHEVVGRVEDVGEALGVALGADLFGDVVDRAHDADAAAVVVDHR